jgi:hypothetical protein
VPWHSSSAASSSQCPPEHQTWSRRRFGDTTQKRQAKAGKTQKRQAKGDKTQKSGIKGGGKTSKGGGKTQKSGIKAGKTQKRASRAVAARASEKQSYDWSPI